MGPLANRFPRYSRLLRLFPAAYQKRYGREILQTLADMLDDPEQSAAMVWLRAAADFPISLIHQQISYGGVALRQMPTYMKRSSLIGGLLLSPFFALVIINSLTSQRLYDSIFWNTAVLFIWLIILPGLAVALNAAAFLRWAAERRAHNKTRLWRSLIDIRHNWPVLAVAVLAFGIIALALGHDSVHCVVGNPITEAQKWDSTWHCIEQR